MSGYDCYSIGSNRPHLREMSASACTRSMTGLNSIEPVQALADVSCSALYAIAVYKATS